MNEAENRPTIEQAAVLAPGSGKGGREAALVAESLDTTSPENKAAAGTQQGKGARSSVQISVVVPLCNEAENVRPLAEAIFSSFAAQRAALEVILVDDGSTDGTWNEVLALHKQNHRVRALRHARRSGQSAALWSGFQAARGEILCTLDGDLQNDPADLPRMIELLKECDLVCGVRTNRQDTALRRMSSRVARGARKAVLHVDFQDTGCNLRAFKRSLLQKVFPFNGLHRFMPVLAHVSGAIVKEIPVTHHARTAGQSKYGLWNRLGRGIWDLAAMAWYRKRQINTVQVVEFEAPESEGKS